MHTVCIRAKAESFQVLTRLERCKVFATIAIECAIGVKWKNEVANVLLSDCDDMPPLLLQPHNVEESTSVFFGRAFGNTSRQSAVSQSAQDAKDASLHTE